MKRRSLDDLRGEPRRAVTFGRKQPSAELVPAAPLAIALALEPASRALSCVINELAEIHLGAIERVPVRRGLDRGLHGIGIRPIDDQHARREYVERLAQELLLAGDVGDLRLD